MSVDGARQRAQASLRDLKVKWAHARESWRDATAAEFGARYVEALEHAIRVAIPAMEKMSALLDRAERECGDPR